MIGGIYLDRTLVPGRRSEGGDQDIAVGGAHQVGSGLRVAWLGRFGDMPGGFVQLGFGAVLQQPVRDLAVQAPALDRADVVVQRRPDERVSELVAAILALNKDAVRDEAVEGPLDRLSRQI